MSATFLLQFAVFLTLYILETTYLDSVTASMASSSSVAVASSLSMAASSSIASARSAAPSGDECTTSGYWFELSPLGHRCHRRSGSSCHRRWLRPRILDYTPPTQKRQQVQSELNRFRIAYDG